MAGLRPLMPLNQTVYGMVPSDDRYQLSDLLGAGAYGRVFRGTSPDGQVVALKEITIPADDQGIPLSTLRELAVLKKLQAAKSPYLVQMLDISLHRNESDLSVYIVFEFIDCDLAHFISQVPQETGLSITSIREMSAQLLRGINFLHSHRIIHRDIKPANILVDKAGKHLKITDFGLSRVLGWESPLTPVVVTLWYRSPEILLLSEYLSPCDVWAAGCIIVELFNLTPIFDGKTDMVVLQKIFNTLGFPPESDWPKNSFLKWINFKKVGEHCILRSKVKTSDSAALEVIERLLTFNSNKRITACGALRLPFFTLGPNVSLPDFCTPSSAETLGTSSSAAIVGTHSVHSRSSLRIASKNMTARPFIPSRHSLMPAPSRPSPASGSSMGQCSVSSAGPMTRQRAAALAGDSSHLKYNNPGRNGNRRFTQPLRPRASLHRTPTIPVLPNNSTTTATGSDTLVGEICADAPSVSSFGRQKRTARRRTVMGVEKAKLTNMCKALATASKDLNEVIVQSTTTTANKSNKFGEGIGDDSEKSEMCSRINRFVSVSSQPCLNAALSSPPSNTSSSSAKRPEASILREHATVCSPPKMLKMAPETSTRAAAAAAAAGVPLETSAPLQSDSSSISDDGESSQVGSQPLSGCWSCWRETARSIPDSADPPEDVTLDDADLDDEGELSRTVKVSGVATPIKGVGSPELLNSVNSLSSVSEVDSSALESEEIGATIQRSENGI